MFINSLNYLFFFPLTAMIYFKVPKKVKPVFLLLANYIFYACFAPIGLAILGAVTAITYTCAVWLETTQHRKMVLALDVVACIGTLALLKYWDWGLGVVVGISFFIFQAVGYIMDVYQGKIPAETNLLKVALFISFFPTISSGPIMRAGDFFRNLQKEVAFDYEKCRRGLLQIAYGIFQKMIIADRLAILVNNVFGNYEKYRGFELGVAAVAFSVEIYCDFAGYSNMAIGSARILGFDLRKNFDCPYFAKSIAEFWRRWHISLSSWFRDYLYIPLGGNRKGKVRKYINLMIVFLVSGVWHGNTLSFLFWGGINGAYQVIGEVLKPCKRKVAEVLCVDTERGCMKLLKVILTFGLTTIAWIFFKAETFGDACGFIRLMFTDMNPAFFIDETIYTLGLDRKEFGVAMLAIMVLLVVDVCQYKKYDFVGMILRQPVVLRWAIYYTVLFAIVIFGVYGGNYSAQDFIYFKF